MERMERETIIENLHNGALSLMNIWKRILGPYDRQNYNITITDTITGENIAVMDLISDLSNRVLELEQQVTQLKEESREADNLFYELMNSLDAVDARIDILTAEKFLKGPDDV